MKEVKWLLTKRVLCALGLTGGGLVCALAAAEQRSYPFACLAGAFYAALLLMPTR